MSLLISNKHLVYFLLLSSFCLILPSQSFAFSDDESIENLIRIFDQDEDVLNRKYSVRHSDEYFNRFEKFYNDWQNRLDELNYEELSQPGKVDYHLLVSHINRRVYFLNRDKEQFENVKQWLPDLNGIMQYINTRRVGTKPDAQNLANEMNQWAIEVETLQSKLQESPMLLKKDANAAHDALEDIRNALEDAFLFYNGYDPDFTWWMEEPYRKLDEVLKTYSEFINEYFDAEKEQMDNSGIVGNPIGEEEILKRLEFEMISYTPEELIEIAEYQFAKSEEEMLKASRELGYGDDWHAALEHVKEAYVEPGRKPELIMRLYNESIDFIEDRDLITIPDLAKEVWRMQMMSPERQLINPFFTGGEVISISYPTNTMGHEQKMMSLRGNNPHFNRATVQHELIPGHHLQGFMNRRYNTYRYPFRTSFWGEGWALYWELLLWDLDFPKSPEDRIGMLFWRTHRYARIIFSLNYHLGNWTPQQCIDYLVERVGHEYANAEAEVRRSFTGNYGPLYQIAYMIGGMEIYSLYKDLVDTDQMSPIEFHDTILKGGSIPIRMVKALLTDEELEKNQTLNWNFADYIYDE